MGGAVRAEAAAGPRARRTAYICYGTGGHYRLTRECGTEGSRVEASAREASTRTRDERSGGKATRRRCLPGHTHSSRLRMVKRGPGVRTLPERTRRTGAQSCGRNLGKPKRCHPRLAVLCCGAPDGRRTACTVELYSRRGQDTVGACVARVRAARRTLGIAGSNLRRRPEEEWPYFESYTERGQRIDLYGNRISDGPPSTRRRPRDCVCSTA